MTCATLLLVVLSACAAPLYSVAPIPKSPPEGAATATSGSLEVSAMAMSDERALAQFDANLPLAGLIAVEVHLKNSGTSPISTSGLRFVLKDADGRAVRSVLPKKALSRVMKYYGVRLYGKEGHARTVEAYESVAFVGSEDLGPASEKGGILFFQQKGPLLDPKGYSLTIEGGGISPINIQLN